MPYYRKWISFLWSSTLLFLCFIGLCSKVYSDAIEPKRLEAEWQTDQGLLTVNSRFKIDLPQALYEALHQGVPLSFRLEFTLTKPKSYVYYQKIRHWFNPDAYRLYRLSYHPFTQHYRVRYGELFSDHTSLKDALSQIGLARSWPVIESSYLSQLNTDKLAGKVQLRLDLNDLPEPFQLDLFGSNNWQLSSSWHAIPIVMKKESF